MNETSKRDKEETANVNSGTHMKEEHTHKESDTYESKNKMKRRTIKRNYTGR